MKRKIVGLVLVLCMLVAFVPYVNAATVIISGTCGENLSWILDSDGILTISGNGEMYDYSSEYKNGYTNYSAPYWSYGQSHIKKVIIESGVTKIGAYAFAGLNVLEEISIPSSVTDIDDSFVYLTFSIKNINVDIDNKDYCSINGILYNKEVTEIIKFPYASDISVYSIPSTIVNIGDKTFYSCKNITKVIVPYGISKIGDWAFDGCINLKDIEIPESVQEFGERTFYCCRSLNGIHIPNGVTSIPMGMIDSCENIYSIQIPNTVTKIGTSAFSGSGLKDITIPDTVLEIESDSFRGCSNLTNVKLPETIKEIKTGTFRNCTNLKSITIPNSVTSIGNEGIFVGAAVGAFSGCNNLQEVRMSSNIKIIQEGMFSGCNNLSDVYYDGTKSQWNNVDIRDDNDALLNATIHYAAEPCFSILQTNTTAKITNTSDEQQSATVIIAEYNDNRLLQVSSNEITFNPNETKIYDTDNNTRVFVWDSLKGMRPLDKSL